MSLSQNLQNILEETFQSFLSMDLSSNLVEQLNNISPNLISSVTSTRPIPENEEHENESLPDLIPIREPAEPFREESARRIHSTDSIGDSTRRIRLWSNILLDYHKQINMYQENMRTIFTITESLLPTAETRSSSYSSNNNNNNTTTDTSRLWQSLLQSPSYVLEFDATNLLNRNTNTNEITIICYA